MEVHDSPAHYYPSEALSLDELAYWIAFNRVSGVGPVSFRGLLKYFSDDLAMAWRADRKELAQAGITQRTIDNILRLRTTMSPQQELERLEKLRIRVVTWRDGEYPSLLKNIDEAPPILYMYGRLHEADQFALGVVGTRNATGYGRQVTERMVSELARGQVTIVSGLALGIDTVAHTAALDAGGRTIAVLACGLDTIYPPVNRSLAKRIVESGQGALITVEHALKQGREIFAVPGSILSSKSAGTNKLIQDGARPVMEVKDILEALNLFLIPQQVEMQMALPENAEERQLLALLGHEPRHVDELIRDCALPTSQVVATLTTMELKGMIRSVGSMQYVLAR